MVWRRHEARVTKVNVIPFLKFHLLFSVLVRDLHPSFILEKREEANIYPDVPETPISQLVYQM